MQVLQALQLFVLLVAANDNHGSDGWSWGWNNGGWNQGQQFAFTSNGPILGHSAPNRSDVVEFLGIPYAKPPVGDLRFAPPAKYTGFSFQEASKFSDDCPASSGSFNFPGFTPQAPRILNYFAQNSGTPQSEDCLTLNVWTKGSPSVRGRKALKPVIVLFYGGRFSAGTTNTPFYYGQFWADNEDVVIVTTNFRSNVFGYPGIPGQPANLGLRDQRLAVEWIKQNAAAFGGDPSKIVLIGQSAGAVAIDYYAYAYQNDPIVSGLISHSGNALSFPLNKEGVVTKNWYNVSSQLGCGSTGDTLGCMRSKSWQDVLAASTKIPAIKAGSPLRTVPGFYPIVDNETVFGDYEERSNAGKFAKIPYLLGNNNNEQGFYAVSAFSKAGVKTTDAEGSDFLLSSFTCPNTFEAANRKKHNVPVWQFRYFGDWDNLRLYPTSGAYHGSDLDVLFGNDAQVSGINPTQAEEQTTKFMQHAWAVFANDPTSGLTGLGWPEYDPAKDSLISIAYDNNPQPNYVNPSVYDSPCSTVSLAGVPTAA